MATITPAGIQSDGLTGFYTALQAAFRSAFGDAISLSEDTPQGQLIGELSIQFTEVEELALHVAAGMNLDGLAGRQVDDWGTLFSLPLIVGERSTATVTFTGTPGTPVPAGTRVRTEANATFVTVADALIQAGGSINVLARADTDGPVQAPAGSLTSIVDVRAGLRSATNTLAAAQGRLAESAAEYKVRYGREVASHSCGLTRVCTRTSAVRRRVRRRPHSREYDRRCHHGPEY